jgi:hypothetical protein
VVFVAIVPDVEPKVYASVCVNEDEARVIVIVDAAPILTEVADTVDALAMLSSVMVALAVMLL